MNTKEQIQKAIDSLEWLKFNIVGTEEPKKNTFEYATKVYLENAIALLKDQESNEILDIIIKKRVQISDLDYCKDVETYNKGRDKTYWLTETEFNKIKERLSK